MRTAPSSQTLTAGVDLTFGSPAFLFPQPLTNSAPLLFMAAWNQLTLRPETEAARDAADPIRACGNYSGG